MTINWATRVILVFKTDLTLVQATPIEVYDLDLDWFRLTLKDLEDDEAGMAYPRTHNNNPPVSVGGVVLARVIELINGYTVTFENGAYVVNLVGANSNVMDRVNPNNVSVRSANSAGLQVVTQGSGVTPQDMIDIAVQVWAKTGPSGDTTMTSLETAAAEAMDANTGVQALDGKVNDLDSDLVAVAGDVDGLGVDLALVRAIETGRWKIANNQMTIYAADKVTPLLVFNLKNQAGLPTMTDVFERVPQ